MTNSTSLNARARNANNSVSQRKDTAAWKKRRRQVGRRWVGLELLESRSMMAGDVAGTLIFDANGNGIKDGENGLPGWTVFIDLDHNGVLSKGDPSAVTNVDGDYLIKNVAAGTKVVYEVVPSGWAPSPTGALDHKSVNVLNGTEVKVDFFNNTAQAGSITGTVWNDLNRNGVRDADPITSTFTDPGLPDWTVFLDANNNRILDPTETFTQTAADGSYSFTGLAGGDYEVTEILPSGWDVTSKFDTRQTATVNSGKVTSGKDFGNVDNTNGSIQGIVWNDLNRNGVRDTDPATSTFTDPGLSNWSVFIDTNNNHVPDPTELNTLTAIDGSYSFTGLLAGDYEITEVLPTGWAIAPTFDTRQTVTVIGGSVTAAKDFVNLDNTNGSIQGTVWNDLNGNNTRDTDPVTGLFTDPGLAGWTVFIDTNNNRTPDPGELATLTAVDGSYSFTGLLPGDYEVTEVLNSGWDVSTLFDTRQTVTVVGGSVSTGADFANFSNLNGSVQGLVWQDLNGDGVRAVDPATGAFTDPPQANWTVFLDLNKNGVSDVGEPSTLTDVNGNYLFTGLQVGDYEVIEVLPSGWEVAPTFSDNYTVAVFGGTVSTSHDFANFNLSSAIPGSVSGTVWNDLNGNGVRDTDPSTGSFTDPGLAGWTIFADANFNGTLDATEAQATSAADGSYTINGIVPGSISIVEIAAAGFHATSPTTGTRSLSLKNAENATGLDFGNAELKDSTIRGVVFADTNKNTVQDSGEHGLAGITVYLDINNNASLDASEPSMVTSADLFYTPAIDEAGTYSFTHLASGTYIVRAIVPTILSATPADQLVHTITITAAEVRSGVNTAAVYRPNEIHGVRFDDANGNHQQDGSETGKAGVTVYVDLNRNNALDAGEPNTVTQADGSYSFTNLATGAYVVREVSPPGDSLTYPQTIGGILWPSGVSNPAVGNVNPTSITTSLAIGQSHHETVSLTLPNTEALTNLVDVFLLFDDTGSFTNNSPIVRSAFPSIISQLQTSLPGIDLGFGVGRFEEYANYAYEYSTGRPFILNQPIVAASTSNYMTSIQAALDRTTPGYGGDQPETDIEALYQLVTGAGFDGNNNGSVLDSGPAGLANTQLNPGGSGDVPSFASFQADLANGVLPAAGTVGGAGFRAGALPIVLVATDTGFAYQPKGETSVTGVGGLSLPLSSLTQTSRPDTPYNSGAGFQQTVTGLNALGALVIGLGTNTEHNLDPRQGLEALSKLTGATNQSSTPIANGTPTPIAPGEPLYFEISTGFASSVSNGVVSAIQNAVTNVAVNITLKASDPRVHIINHTGTLNGIASGKTATFDVEFIGDGVPHRFDLQFVREGTDVVLGSIPVVIGTPIPGDGYEFEDLTDGQIVQGVDFGGTSGVTTTNHAPTDISLSNNVVLETAGVGTLIGTFNTTDVDAGDTFAYSFATGAGSTDNGSFTLVNNELHTKYPLDFLTQNSYSIRLASTDAGGLSIEKEFTVSVTDVNTPPVLVASGPTDGFGGVRGQSRTFHLAVADDVLPSSSPTYTFDINWGDGTPAEKLTGGLSFDVSHVYATAGTFSPTFQATDAGLLGSNVETKSDTIVANELQGYVLAFGGTSVDDVFTLTPSSSIAQAATLLINGVNQGAVTVPAGGLALFGGTGNDRLIFNGTSLAEAFTSSDSSLAWNGVAPWASGFAVAKDAIESQRVNGLAGDDSLILTSGNSEYDGGAGIDQLTATNSDNAWQINGVNLGKLNGTAWLNTEQLTGGTGNDTFAFAVGGKIGGALNGDGGIDTLDYSLLATTVNVNLQTKTASNVVGMQNVERFIGSSASNDAITADNLTNDWQVDSIGSESTLNGSTSIINFENLKGNAGADTFTIRPTTTTGPAISGGAGVDSLNYGAWSSDVSINLETSSATGLALIGGLENYSGGSGNNTLAGTHLNTGWVVNGPNSGKIGAATFDKFGTLVGNAGNDTFSLSGVTASLSGSIDGGLGLNKLVGDASANAWNISGANEGTLNAIPFSNIANLTGGAGIDTFTLAAAGSISGTLNGGAGSDILDLTVFTSPITVDLLTKTASGVAVISGLERYDAPSSGGDTLRGLDTANNVKLTGLNSGTLGTVIFNGFENLTGGAGNDSFTLLPGGSLSGGTISGGGGTNTLTGPNLSSTWNITGVGAGDVNGVPFNSINNITGGTANDVFNIAEVGSLSGKLNAGLGDNTLSYAAWASDVTINAAVNTATAVGVITGSNLTVLIGGSGNDTILSNGSKASVLIGGAGNDALTGSGQRDILLGGTGADTLVGGAGDDILFGGTTGYESNVAALLSLLAEWKGSSLYPTRLDHLRGTVGGGLNDTAILANSPIDTLIDDGEIDTLTGGLGRDWFIAGLNDLVVDRVTSGTAAESLDNA